jgi:hypothetical protein
MLEEKFPLAMVVKVPALVSRAIDDIKEGEELGEMGADGLMA